MELKKGQFYELHARRAEVAAEAQNSTPFDPDRHWKEIRGLLPLSDPAYHQVGGKDVRDVILGTLGGHYLIHERILAAWREAQVTGFRTVPVTFRTYSDEVLRCYQFLVVTGRCGEMPMRGIRPANPPSLSVEKGMRLDLDTWDGSDIFIPEEHPNAVLVTKKVMKLCKAQKPRGFVFVDILDALVLT